jgi:hypothetical protein
LGAVLNSPIEFVDENGGGNSGSIAPIALGSKLPLQLTRVQLRNAMAARNKLFGLIFLLIKNQRNKKIGGKQGVDLIKSKANCMPAWSISGSALGRHFLGTRLGSIHCLEKTLLL